MIYSILKGLFIWPIRVYQQTLSAFFPPTCRHMPTCSQYMIQAIEEHGVWRGLGLGIKRILTCHPFGRHGYDPVPSKESSRVA